MRVIFYDADKPRERALAAALAEGMAQFGDSLEIRLASEFERATDDVEVACVFGVKGRSRDIMRSHRKLDIPTLFFDKGYTREIHPHGPMLRVSVNNIQPLDYFQCGRPTDRWEKLGIQLLPRQRPGGHILFAGSSQKYCTWYGLRDCTLYAQKIVKRIRLNTSQPIVYRPKPSWRDAVPIRGTRFSRPPDVLADALRGAHVLVTHGSGAALYALCAGIAVITLGNGITLPVSETDLVNIKQPHWPDDATRLQWAADMAYCQWTLAEYRSGEAWQYIRPSLGV